MSMTAGVSGYVAMLFSIMKYVRWINPSKAREKFGWQARYKMHDVVRLMVNAQLNTDAAL